MKKLILVLGTTFAVFATATAQTTSTGTKITNKNSWLKVGAQLGVPTGNAANVSNFTAGLDFRGQLMETPNWGLGLSTGYTHFFAKEGAQDFGRIPLGLFLRYYPEAEGFFAGLGSGYNFFTGAASSGGVYLNPQIGWHNYDWNVYGFYNHTFRDNANGGDVANVGIGVTYNLRFD